MFHEVYLFLLLFFMGICINWPIKSFDGFGGWFLHDDKQTKLSALNCLFVFILWPILYKFLYKFIDLPEKKISQSKIV